MSENLIIKEWQGGNAVECFESIAEQPYALFLDSNMHCHALNNWSFICWNPTEIIETKNNVITHNGKTIKETDFFKFLDSRLQSYNIQKDIDIPFIGGAAGYFGYDLGRQIETLPDLNDDDINAPDACIGIYTNVLAFDHQNNKAWKIGNKEFPEKTKTSTLPISEKNWKTNKSKSEYLNDIEKVIEYIKVGEIYQACLTRRFEADLPENFNNFTHYKKLRVENPAPFSAYMNFGDMQLVSSSPERFIKVENGMVETRPIKGTLPSSQPQEILEKSAKDRAENIMIVDLLRNDLSRVCDFHSVTVPTLCQLETFEGLHHLVSIVRGVLQKDKTAIDLLKACFPGGSISGAPKIRAMEIIEELEPTKRGPSFGAMGYIDFNGDIDTNIIIRTLIYKNNKAYLQTGSGIVSDSIPENELKESLDKASKIFESFKG